MYPEIVPKGRQSSIPCRCGKEECKAMLTVAKIEIWYRQGNYLVVAPCQPDENDLVVYQGDGYCICHSRSTTAVWVGAGVGP